MSHAGRRTAGSYTRTFTAAAGGLWRHRVCVETSLLTADQLADLLGVTPAWVRKRTRQHAIPAINLRAGEPDALTRPVWRYEPARVIEGMRRASA